MIPRNFILLSLFIALSASAGSAELCSQPFLDSAATVSAEGRFINRLFSRVRVDLVWKHRPVSADTFDITLSGKESFRYISTPDFRTMEFMPKGVKRQMAMHHLKERIGDSPLKWDDLELLARGAFLCPDSAHRDSSKRYTAFSQAWFSLSAAASRPDSLRMNGTRGESRTVHIHAWKNYDGLLLPSIVDIQENSVSGTLWIRTAKRDRAVKDGEQKRFPDADATRFRIFSLGNNGTDGNVEIPLILQMH